MAKIPPMPLEPWHNSKTVRLLPTIAEGAIFKIIREWWLAGCPKLDLSNDALRTIGQIRPYDWPRLQKYVLPALNEIMPPLAEYFKIYSDKRLKKVAAGMRGLAKVEQNRKTKLRTKQLIDKVEITQIPVVPLKTPNSHRQKSYVAPKPTQATRGVVLSDAMPSNPFGLVDDSLDNVNNSGGNNL